MRIGRHDLMHLVPERLWNDGRVLAGIGFALVHRLTQINAVDEQLVFKAMAMLIAYDSQTK
jgi:hypothetical protein